jgi:RNA polymerase sigma-70 factor (ECF subfamily)
VQELVDEVAQRLHGIPAAVRSDVELLDSWRGGDKAAGEELVARYWTSISRFFRSKIGDDGADLISQTFLACVEARDRIDGDNMKAYLFSVARRRLADHFRKRARSPITDLAVSSVIDLGTGPATHAGRRERSELLRDALARIPLDDQIALELAYFEGLSTREIADVLEIEENTVRSRLSRAREKLRAVLVTLAPPDEAALAESQLG